MKLILLEKFIILLDDWPLACSNKFILCINNMWLITLRNDDTSLIGVTHTYYSMLKVVWMTRTIWISWVTSLMDQVDLICKLITWMWPRLQIAHKYGIGNRLDMVKANHVLSQTTFKIRNQFSYFELCGVQVFILIVNKKLSSW